MGPDAMVFIFWMLSFKPAFSLSSFTFKRLFSSSLLSAIRLVPSAYLRLLIFLPTILTPSVTYKMQQNWHCTWVHNIEFWASAYRKFGGFCFLSLRSHVRSPGDTMCWDHKEGITGRERPSKRGHLEEEWARPTMSPRHVTPVQLLEPQPEAFLAKHQTQESRRHMAAPAPADIKWQRGRLTHCTLPKFTTHSTVRNS